MRHRIRQFLIAIAAALGIVAPFAHACTCIQFDADFITADFELIFVAEITALKSEERVSAKFVDRDYISTPFTYRVLEVVKGNVPLTGRLLALGAPSSCQPHLVLGERYVFTMGSKDQVVGYCHIGIAHLADLPALRASMAKKR
jgi:hypothetical protein